MPSKIAKPCFDEHREDELVFPSGQRLYFNRGIIGLAPDLTVFGGYDHGMEPFENKGLSEPEWRSLCDYMIERWEELKAKHKGSAT